MILETTGTAQSPKLEACIKDWFDATKRSSRWAGSIIEPINKGVVRVHFAKTIQPHYCAMYAEEKTAEMRIDDRNYKSGDYLCLEEYPYTTNALLCQISHTLKHKDFPDGIKPNWAMLSVELIWIIRGWHGAIA